MSPPASRRLFLPSLTQVKASHAGLALDKYLDTQAIGNEVNPSREPHLTEVIGVPIPYAYTLHFQRWQQSLNAMKQAAEKRDETVLLATATTTARWAVGLGAESILETNISLHRTYGAPYIPGSALKGLAAAYAHKKLEKEWQRGGKDHNILFGNSDSRGYVTFFDALYDPSSKLGGPLHRDVLTVHHPAYYRGEKDAAPADWDNPIPVSFVSAVGMFLVALAGPTKWVARAYELLKLSLAEEGIGAKTNSGYGRILLSQYAYLKKQLLEEQAPAGRLRGEIEQLSDTGRHARVTSSEKKEPLFVHQEQFLSPDDLPLRKGQIVEYSIDTDQRAKRTQAIKVNVLLQPEV